MIIKPASMNHALVIGINDYVHTDVYPKLLSAVKDADDIARKLTERKQSFRAVLCTLIYISTFVPNLNFGQDEHKRRRQVLCLNGSQVPNRVQEQKPSRVL